MGTPIQALEQAFAVQNFFKYEETHEAPLNEHTCQCFTFARLHFLKMDPILSLDNNYRLGLCANLSSITVCLGRPLAGEDLLFLYRVKKLKELILIDTPEVNSTNDGPALCSGQVLNEIADRISTVEKLDVYGDIFGYTLGEVSNTFATLSICFPVLKELKLSGIQIIPETIFVHLSKLTCLEVLKICHTRAQLTEGMFTQPCESQRLEEGGGQIDAAELTMVPAINAFRMLRELELTETIEMIDETIVQQIALSKTLRKVVVTGLPSLPFTEGNMQALRNGQEGFVQQNCKVVFTATNIQLVFHTREQSG